MMKFVLLFALVAVAVSLRFERVDVNSSEVQAAANQAAKELSKQLSGKFQHRLVKVNTAQKGHDNRDNADLYNLQIIIGMTTCKKSEVPFEQSADCELQTHISTYKKCEALVKKDSSGNLKLADHGCILASKTEV